MLYIYSNCKKQLQNYFVSKVSKAFFLMIVLTVLSGMITSVVNAQNLSETNVREMFKVTQGIRSVPELNQQYVVSDAYYDQNTGINYIYLQQTYLGVKVYNAIKVVIIKDGKLAYTSGKFVSNIANIVSDIVPAVAANDAIVHAASYVNLKAPANLTITDDQFTLNNKITFSDGGIAREKIETELLWVSTDDFNLVKLCWNVNIDDNSSSNWWNVRIDAKDGSFIDKNNWTVSCNFSNHNNKNNNNQKAVVNNVSAAKAVKFNHLNFENKINKFAAAPPLNITAATYFVLPFPFENINVGTMAVDSAPWMKAGVGNNATTYGWNYDGTTNYNITRGNNTQAYDDSLNKNAPGRYDTSSTALPILTFPLIPDFTQVPTTPNNRRAATTNLFYWNNIMHDIAYQYGFDELAGNFQNDNMNRGGKAKDYVHAEAQDGSGTDNANFSAPPDGTSGRMQMYLWTYTSPGRDGDFDAGVMSHEFTHGISIRLTGGPSQASCLTNAEQGGEGWSDYNALMVTTNWATAKLTDGALKRPIGNYVIGQAQTGAGIRTYPYSTSMTIDKHTYADLSKNVGGVVGEVHYIGEIWASALWDMTWNIIQQEGTINPNIYDANGGGGNTIAMNLMITGLKLQPCCPGYLDARNAILAADSILYNNRHKCAIWNAFARRGMGFSATEGSPNSVTDQKTATDVPSDVIFTKYEPLIIAQNQTFSVPVQTNCTCKAPTSNYTIKATLPNGLTYSSGGTDSANVVKFKSINYATTTQSDSETLVLTASGAGCAIDSVINDNRDNNTVGGFTSGLLSGASGAWGNSTTFSHSPTTSWYVTDPVNATELALISGVFVPQSLSVFSFWHRWDLENHFDGGIVEISPDSGNTWIDAKPYFIKSPYTGVVDSTNYPIAKQMAFTGFSNGLFYHSLIDLSSFAGLKTKVRFHMSTTSSNLTSTALGGWYIDDIAVANGCGGVIKLVAYDSANRIMDSSSIPVFIINALPVRYAGFYAQQVGKESLLRWIVSEEINTKLYSVERSANGTTWTSIGTTPALGINNNEYIFHDEAPLMGTNYYRIKAIDKDGQFSYSDIRQLKYTNNSNQVLIVPNPSSYQSKVYITSSASNAKVSVYDAQGRLVMSNGTSLQNGEFILSTSRLVNGVYILHIDTQDGNVYSEKLLIEK